MGTLEILFIIIIIFKDVKLKEGMSLVKDSFIYGTRKGEVSDKHWNSGEKL